MVESNIWGSMKPPLLLLLLMLLALQLDLAKAAEDLESHQAAEEPTSLPAAEEPTPFPAAEEAASLPVTDEQQSPSAAEESSMSLPVAAESASLPAAEEQVSLSASKELSSPAIDKPTSPPAAEEAVSSAAEPTSAEATVRAAEDFSSEPAEVRQLFHLEKPTPVTDFPTIETWAGGEGPGAGPLNLHMPYGAFYVESSGQLYVSDTHNHRVQKVSVGSGTVPTTVAGGHGQGRGLNQLRFPKGIVVDSAGNVFVADSGNHRVVKWAPDATEGVVVAGEYGALLDKQGVQQGSEAFCCRAGRAMQQLQDPHGIFVDGDGIVYVADTGNNRVQRWEGQVATTVAGGDLAPPGQPEQALLRPESVFMKNDIIYVSDSGHNRVLTFTTSVTKVFFPATSAGKTCEPQGGTPTTEDMCEQACNSGVGGATNFATNTWTHSPGCFVVVGGEWTGKCHWNQNTDNSIEYTPENTAVCTKDAALGTAVAGGQGRGAGLQQLVSPAGIWVDDSFQENGVAVTELFVVDTYNHRVMKHRMTGDYLDAEPSVVAGGCLQNPPYIAPCIGGGIHYPPNPLEDRVDLINPSNTNPPVYHFWGPMGIFLGQGGRNITVADTLNHRVLTWVGYR